MTEQDNKIKSAKQIEIEIKYFKNGENSSTIWPLLYDNMKLFLICQIIEEYLRVTVVMKMTNSEDTKTKERQIYPN